MPVWDVKPYPNVTSFYDSILYANEATNGFFAHGLVFTLWSIFFIIFRRHTKNDIVAFAAAGYMTFALSSVLWAVGLVDESVILILAILMGISTIFMRKGF